jgi:hypothetical protein
MFNSMTLSCLGLCDHRVSRYGLISRWSIIILLFAMLCAATLIGPAGPSVAHAQSWPFQWNSAKWFDWSDYRLRASGRGAFYRLESGTLRWGDQEFSLVDDYNLIQDTGPHISGAFELYVDRLGIRVYIEDTQFDATRDSTLWTDTPNFKLGLFRGGLDLDLIRYPSAAFGINFDYSPSDVEFLSTRSGASIGNVPDTLRLEAEGPMTLGLHGRIIPIRIKEVPFEASARVRSSFFRRADQTWLFEWEVQGGLRPAIWETSLFGHSTFSVSIQGGYRSTYLDFHTQRADGAGGAQTAEISAHWHGPFAEIQLLY